MEVVNTFPPVAAEYCWGVINLHSLAQDKEPINWKELLKDEDRGAVTATATGTWLNKCSSTERTKVFFSYSFTMFHDGFNFGALSGDYLYNPVLQCWGWHLSVRADCWICLLSLVSWSASGGSWWGKHLQRWMRSWPSRCTSLLNLYSCREKMRE